MSDKEYAKKISDILDKEYPNHDSIVTNLVRAAREAALPLSLACGLVDQESDFENVFGHDPTIFVGAGTVTKAKYDKYKAERDRTGRMQGVGPVQLTSKEFQDEADRLGGCWKPYYNMLEGFRLLSKLIASHGRHAGIARYNGGNSARGEANGQAYARSVEKLVSKWHARLT